MHRMDAREEPARWVPVCFFTRDDGPAARELVQILEGAEQEVQRNSGQ